MKTYYTHDNGGRPFKVVVNSSEKKVNIYKRTKDDYDVIFEKDILMSFKYKQIFIGKSSNHTKEFDGNSILLYLGKDTYIFIGERILQFTYNIPIKSYASDVGNSDVPYPYAVDENGDVLFMLEMRLYKMVKYDKKQFNDPIGFIYFKDIALSSLDYYKKFTLYDKNDNPIYFKHNTKVYQINDEKVSKKEFINMVIKLAPKSKPIKYKTLAKRDI